MRTTVTAAVLAAAIAGAGIGGYELGTHGTVSIVSNDDGAGRIARPPVVVYEDGSGVQYVGDTEVRTFPADTFVWDCRVHGNRVCGDLGVVPDDHPKPADVPVADWCAGAVIPSAITECLERWDRIPD